MSKQRAPKTTAEKIAEADNAACRHLANHNAARERGAVKTAEREFWKAQRALDRLNRLRGAGDYSAPSRSV